MVTWRVMCPDRPAWGAYEWIFVDSLDVVLQIIKSQIKVIVLIARVDIFFFNSQNFYIN